MPPMLIPNMGGLALTKVWTLYRIPIGSELRYCCAFTFLQNINTHVLMCVCVCVCVHRFAYEEHEIVVMKKLIPKSPILW